MEPVQLDLPFGQPMYMYGLGPTETDAVNNPEHYTLGKIEVFDFIQAWDLDFPAGNVVKYVVRAPYKGKQLQDLKKARWYLDRLIEQAEAAA